MPRGDRVKGSEPRRSIVLARIECPHRAIRPLEVNCAHLEYARRDRFRARLNARSETAARERGWRGSRSEDRFGTGREAVGCVCSRERSCPGRERRSLSHACLS